jgi:hypothetical protein
VHARSRDLIVAPVDFWTSRKSRHLVVLSRQRRNRELEVRPDLRAVVSVPLRQQALRGQPVRRGEQVILDG